MFNTRVFSSILVVLVLSTLVGCASMSPGTTAAVSVGLTGAIAGLQHALATGVIEPELGGNLLAALTVVQQQMGEHAAVASAATKMAAEVSTQLATTQGTLGDVQTTGIVSGAAIGAYALRKPAIATALAVLRAVANTPKVTV